MPRFGWADAPAHGTIVPPSGMMPSIWLLKALKDQFEIDPVWILEGPEDVPQAYKGVLDWERFVGIHTEVERILRHIGIKPTYEERGDTGREVAHHSVRTDLPKPDKLVPGEVL